MWTEKGDMSLKPQQTFMLGGKLRKGTPFWKGEMKKLVVILIDEVKRTHLYQVSGDFLQNCFQGSKIFLPY